MDPIRYLPLIGPVAVVAVGLDGGACSERSCACRRIPIQLAPDVRKPIVVVEIRTIWPGAAPAEVEREIVNPNRKKRCCKAWTGLKKS